MELDGVIRKKLEQARDQRRFFTELEKNPEAVEAANLAMLTAIRSLVERAERVEEGEESFMGTPPHHTFLRFATPWLCETTSDELGVTAKMRLATNRTGDEDQTVWCGAVEVLITDTEAGDDEYNPQTERLATFVVYEPTGDDDARLVMAVASQDDFGLEGSASWNGVQSLLDEAIQEVIPVVTQE